MSHSRSAFRTRAAAIASGALILLAVVGFGVWQTRAGHVTASGEPAPGATQTKFGGDNRPVALFAGDSFTNGVGSDGTGSYAQQVANNMGWSLRLDAESATGFTTTGVAAGGSRSNQIMIDRLAVDRAKWSPAIVVVDAGRNDGRASSPAVIAAAVAYVNQAHTLWPQAKIVFLAPSYVRVAPAGGYTDALAKGVAAAAGQDLALTINPSAEGWWTDVAAPSQYVITDKVHPNPAGHKYIAQRLTGDLRAAGLVDLTPVVFTTPTPSSSPAS